MQLHRLVLSWQGPQVHGSAVTVLHFDGSNQSSPPVAAVKSAFQAAYAVFPLGTSITVPNSGDTIEDTTGALTGVWSGTGGGTINGGGQTGAAGGVGACISWTTGGIVIGKKGPRKLRGRTFLVPLHKDAYGPDGTLDDGTLSTLRTLANALQAAGPLAIWHRPTAAAPASGNSYGVLSNAVKDHVAILTSRRD